MVKLIVAIGPNGLIGDGDKMPWNIPKEFAHFKKTTLGHTLFMGGTTFNGLPGKLPNRKMVIFNINKVDGVEKTINSLGEAKEYLAKNKNSKEIIFISGGKFVYETFSEYADEWIISHINTTKTGNIYLDLDLSSRRKELFLEENDFTVYNYFK